MFVFWIQFQTKNCTPIITIVMYSDFVTRCARAICASMLRAVPRDVRRACERTLAISQIYVRVAVGSRDRRRGVVERCCRRCCRRHRVPCSELHAVCNSDKAVRNSQTHKAAERSVRKCFCMPIPAHLYVLVRVRVQVRECVSTYYINTNYKCIAVVLCVCVGVCVWEHVHTIMLISHVHTIIVRYAHTFPGYINHLSNQTSSV